MLTVCTRRQSTMISFRSLRKSQPGTSPGHSVPALLRSTPKPPCLHRTSAPEITRLPADGLVLQMKAMGIDKVVNFPFPTPPSQDALRVGGTDRSGLLARVHALMMLMFLMPYSFGILFRTPPQGAERVLKILNALDNELKVTALGRAMSK